MDVHTPYIAVHLVQRSSRFEACLDRTCLQAVDVLVVINKASTYIVGISSTPYSVPTTHNKVGTCRQERCQTVQKRRNRHSGRLGGRTGRTRRSKWTRQVKWVITTCNKWLGSKKWHRRIPSMASSSSSIYPISSIPNSISPSKQNGYLITLREPEPYQQHLTTLRPILSCSVGNNAQLADMPCLLAYL